jgi:hypothetical protein
MKPTDQDLISKLLSLPEPALAELLAMVGGSADRRADEDAPPQLPAWAMRAGEGGSAATRPGGGA